MSTDTATLQWDLVDRLGKSLRIAGLKPGQMADHLEVHRNTVSAYLHGKTVPDHRTLALWAMRCGVPLDWLKTGAVPQQRGDVTLEYLAPVLPFRRREAPRAA